MTKKEVSWKDLYVKGAKGSEGGMIVKDEEYKESCRITLEKGGDITCGIYGEMVHTVFCKDDEEGLKTYNKIKKELQDFIDKVEDGLDFDHRVDFYDYFCNHY